MGEASCNPIPQGFTRILTTNPLPRGEGLFSAHSWRMSILHCSIASAIDARRVSSYPAKNLRFRRVSVASGYIAFRYTLAHGL